jgi:hypothetical protein
VIPRFLGLSTETFIPVVILLFMPDSPTRTQLFSEDDKVLLVERVRSNDQGLKQKHFKMNQVIEAAKDPFTYLLFLLAVSQTVVVGGLGNFSSLLINKAFGFDVSTSSSRLASCADSVPRRC